MEDLEALKKRVLTPEPGATYSDLVAIIREYADFELAPQK